MAQTGFTPIKLYSSSTAAVAPSAANLSNTNGSELAINITDGKLYYKDNLGAVQVIAYKNVPVSTLSGLGANVATFLATPSSANLRTAVTDETGTGSLVFATSPTLVTPNLGTPSTLVGTNITGTAAGLSIGGNAATATTATNQSGGSVNATTGAFSGALTSTSTIQTNAGYVASGVGSGATALTTNDGYGNASLAFNHTNGIPDVTGSSARITSPVDGSAASMIFQLASNTTSGVVVALPAVMTLVPTLVSTQVPFSVAGTATATSFSGAGTGLTGTASGLSIGGNAVNVTGVVAIENGGSAATTASAARTNFGATTLGSNLFTLANVAAIRFPRINADNTVSTLDAATFRTAIGAGTSSTTGTVTSVSGTGTVSGLTLSGTVTTSGNLTLGGTLSISPSGFGSQTANTILAAPNGVAGNPTFRALLAADVPTLNQNTTGTAANVTGTVAVANGGTGSTTAAGARANLGAGTVTSVGAAGSVNGITLTGSVTSSGNLTLGGTLSGVSLTTQISGTLPVANGGTGSTTAAGARTNLGAQETLVSGTNIKTVNGTSLLGSGDVSVGSFPSGTAMLFAQTAAPTGWTKSTTHDNKTLRVVSGTAASGGSVAFTTAFASQAVGGTVNNTTLTTTQIPSHTHIQRLFTNAKGGTREPGTNDLGGTTQQNASDNLTTAATGGGAAHNHTFTGTAINLAVQYVDVIIATKG